MQASDDQITGPHAVYQETCSIPTKELSTTKQDRQYETYKQVNSTFDSRIRTEITKITEE